MHSFKERAQQFGNYLFDYPAKALWLVAGAVAIDWLNWFAVVVLMLFTLRRGARSGAAFLSVIIVVNLIKYAVTQNPVYLFSWLGDGLLGFAFACMLRATVAWATTLEIATLLGIVIIVIAHQFVDLTVWWEGVLRSLIPLWKNWGILPQYPDDMIHQFAKIATGVIAAEVIAVTTLKLIIARYWQALLFNAGGLKQEIRNLRLHAITAFIFLLFLAAGIAHHPLALDILALPTLLFLFAGLCFFHTVVAELSQRRWLLTVLGYGFMIIVPIFSTIILIGLAVIDSVFDLHKRLITHRMV